MEIGGDWGGVRQWVGCVWCAFKVWPKCYRARVLLSARFGGHKMIGRYRRVGRFHEHERAPARYQHHLLADRGGTT